MSLSFKQLCDKVLQEQAPFKPGAPPPPPPGLTPPGSPLTPPGTTPGVPGAMGAPGADPLAGLGAGAPGGGMPPPMPGGGLGADPLGGMGGAPAPGATPPQARQPVKTQNSVWKALSDHAEKVGKSQPKTASPPNSAPIARKIEPKSLKN